MFGPEVALDELAVQLGLDPVELRLRNEPTVHPESGHPFSSRNLVACLQEGASRFGWDRRDPTPGARVVDGWQYGTGVASSVYPVIRASGTTVAIRYDAEIGYTVLLGAADLGTGAWTVLTQIAADALWVDPASVHLYLGDTDFPFASVAGGSSGTTTWGSAIVQAARAFRERFGNHPVGGEQIEGSVPENPYRRRFAMSAFGAQFAEVAVRLDSGEVRVPRLLGVFAVGRVLNPRTARSQLVGGMTMGLSTALHEQSVLDARFGHVVNRDLAQYHIATNADISSIEARWIDEDDQYVNPMGSKGIGEIGIVGTAAAIANAAYHATGIRVRDLPLTLDEFLV
jgi:xanthine dehydrogenase YagR molybdenum-binding subunit